MRLWTLQPAYILEELETTGTYRCRKDLSFNLSKADSLQPKYEWLNERMCERIGPMPDGVSFPVWAWHTWEGERRCPDVNSAAFLKRTEDKVLLTLEVPEDAVVLTDFDAWQVVLNHGFLTNETDETKLDELDEYLDSLSDEELDQALEASWDHVFEVDRIDHELLQRGYFIQATLWEIKKENVVDQKLIPINT